MNMLKVNHLLTVTVLMGLTLMICALPFAPSPNRFKRGNFDTINTEPVVDSSGPIDTNNNGSISVSASSATSADTSVDTSLSTSSNSSGGGARKGQASYYTEWSSNPGSCGFIPTESDICAIHPSNMPAKCNSCILVDYNGNKLKVKVTDTCPGCSPDKIDLSDKAFQKLAGDLGKGIINITWEFVPC